MSILRTDITAERLGQAHVGRDVSIVSVSGALTGRLTSWRPARRSEARELAGIAFIDQGDGIGQAVALRKRSRVVIYFDEAEAPLS
jgi:hypothetical protein